MTDFVSTFQKIKQIQLPEFSNTRIMMMPVVLGDMNSIPDTLEHYKDTISNLFEMQNYDGHIGYLTIDEKTIAPQETHRRAGKHVDGIYIVT